MNNNIKDRVMAAVTGYSIGDALGLSTAFMTREEIKVYYPEGLTDYSQTIMDAHRAQWGRGESTHDSQLVWLAAENMMRNGGKLNIKTFPAELSDWYESDHYDLSVQIRLILGNPGYTADPAGTVRNLWQQLGAYTESNAMLGILAIMALTMSDIAADSADLCSIMQIGLKSQGCCHILAETVQRLLLGKPVPTPEELGEIADTHSQDLRAYIEGAANPAGMESLGIDDQDTSWMVGKTMATALWALWNADSFEDGLVKVTALGGDANTNAALAAFLLGLKFGMKGIPPKYIDGLRDKDRLLSNAERFGDFIATYYDKK